MASSSVIMATSGRRRVVDYLSGVEELRRIELEWGVVREPPAPYCDHQSIVTRSVVLLAEHVNRERLGRVIVSPVDVVLDEQKALVVQPDIVFVSRDRLEIIQQQIWGAPDLVLEVLSAGTKHRDRTNKYRWYRRYGVREYWIVDLWARRVEVISFAAAGRARKRAAHGATLVTSHVLPEFRAPAGEFFDDLF